MTPRPTRPIESVPATKGPFVNPTSTTPSRPAAAPVPPNLTLTVTVDHLSGTVAINAVMILDDGRQMATPILPPTTVANPEHATTTCTIAAPVAGHWSVQTDDTPRPGTWPLSVDGASVPDGYREYAFDTTTDLRVRVLAPSLAEARQEVLAGAGDCMELFTRFGALLVTSRVRAGHRRRGRGDRPRRQSGRPGLTRPAHWRGRAA